MVKQFKFLNFFILSISTLFFFNTCGIEDNVIFFQEPKNLAYNSSTYELYFDGYNQEQDGGTKMFIGYDVYYFYDDPKNAKLANIRNPVLPLIDPNYPSFILPPVLHNTNLLNIYGEIRYNSGLTSNDRDTIFQWTTCPVTDAMINSVLTKGSSKNVWIALVNLPNGYPPNSNVGNNNPLGQSNPEINPNITSQLFVNELFPNYSEYSGQTWYSGLLNPVKFLGFFDANYVKNMVPPSAITVNTFPTYYYNIYFYVVAKGFNSKTEMTRSDKIIQSIQSNIIKINIGPTYSNN